MTQQLVSSRTIAAIATGSGGGVGIVRVSGPQALQIGQKVCAPWPSDLLSHHLYLGHAQSLRLGGQASASATSDPQGLAPSSLPARIDQVLFVVMRAPHSYTGEDVLEIHGHGGAITLHLILEACLDAGADSAAPGEFTRRAFLAGKLDLTAAEAVAQLVSAQSVSAARQAQRQLHGELGRVVAELRRRLTVLLGDFEGMLDFPDLDADTEVLARAQPELAASERPHQQPGQYLPSRRQSAIARARAGPAGQDQRWQVEPDQRPVRQ
jgi:tRNA modification GTPase